MVAWYIAIQVTAIVQCLPIRYYWQRTGQGYCIHLIRFNIALASINLVTDVAVLILPIPAIWRLQLPKSKKIGLSAVFLAGLLYVVSSSVFEMHKGERNTDFIRSVCIASVIRLKTLTGIDAKDITCQSQSLHISHFYCMRLTYSPTDEFALIHRVQRISRSLGRH